ncbi:hypothetical protein [Bizionia sp. M204]|uniref:hypothetical protein n=1 Tax=Bizionia sp. M204 TaxID=2675331 RepID=UPI00204718CD|nr:hypothetical protein [Bizionia sp. M204]UPS90809.1 hypothetical protein GMA17_03360 [Bizionia sp. M204]
MKTKFQLHIAISLLLVYVLNFGTAIHDVFIDSFSESTFKTQTADKQSKDDSSRFYAYQDLEILGNTPTDFESADDFTDRFVTYNNTSVLDASQTARDNQYVKAGQYIIPSYNTQTCIFPFHDFI